MTEPTFTNLERKTLFSFLDYLSDRFGNAGCNDLELPNTEEGKALITEVIRYNYPPEEVEQELAYALGSKGSIITMDTMVLDYLRDKLERLLYD